MSKINRTKLEQEILRDLESLAVKKSKPTKKQTSKKLLKKTRKISLSSQDKIVARKRQEPYFATETKIELNRAIEVNEDYDLLIDDLVKFAKTEISKFKRRNFKKFTLGLEFSFKSKNNSENFQKTFSERFQSLKRTDIKEILDSVFAQEFKEKFISYIMSSGESRLMIHALIVEAVKGDENHGNEKVKTSKRRRKKA